MQNDLLSQLHDIHAIDTVDWWPLAIGWWLLIALIMATLLCVYGFAIYKKRQAQRWQKQADAILQDVENEADPQKKAQALSELLRRLAIQKYGRESCAGLYGEKWLQWLSEHDPANFDWQAHGQLLLNALYAPQTSLVENEFTPMLKATKKWIK